MAPKTGKPKFAAAELRLRGLSFREIDVQTDSASRLRLQRLVERLHALGPSPLLHFLTEVRSGEPLRPHFGTLCGDRSPIRASLRRRSIRPLVALHRWEAAMTAARVINFRTIRKKFPSRSFRSRTRGRRAHPAWRLLPPARRQELAWLAAKPYEKQDGTKSWANIVDFVDNNSKYLLHDEVLPLVLAAMAEGAHR